jgi:hypothetical protein
MSVAARARPPTTTRTTARATRSGARVAGAQVRHADNVGSGRVLRQRVVHLRGARALRLCLGRLEYRRLDRASVVEVRREDCTLLGGSFLALEGQFEHVHLLLPQEIVVFSLL